MPTLPDPTPKRIQMRRTRGWRKPPDAIYVGRPSRWGNPYRVVRGGTPGYRVWWADGPGLHGPILCKTRYAEVEAVEDAVDAFRRLGRSSYPDLNWLTGHDLACWCPLTASCHADVLLEWANR